MTTLERIQYALFLFQAQWYLKQKFLFRLISIILVLDILRVIIKTTVQYNVKH